MNENILSLLGSPLVPEAHAKVLSYFEEVKGSDTGWQLAVSELTRPSDNLSDHVKYFCWQIFENFVKTRYPVADGSCQIVRDFLFRWLQNMATSAKDESSFVKNKAAQMFSLIFVIDFPRRWPSFLLDFLQTLKLGPKAVNFYLRVMKAIDSEVVDREIPHSKEETERNTLIKDTIRETCINDLVDSWYQICTIYETSHPALVAECLEVMGAYISWIDISLIANERFVVLFVRFMTDQNLRESNADCLSEVISKGMDPGAKVKLVESLYVLLERTGILMIDNEEDSDYLCKLGKLVNTMGTQLSVAWTKAKKANDVESTTAALQGIESKLPVLLTFLRNGDDDVSASVFDFCKEYILILKQKPTLTSVDMHRLESIIEVIFEKMKYEQSHDFENDGEEEAQFLEFRKQIKNLYDNIAGLDSDLVLRKTRDLVTATLARWQSLHFQDVEVAITFLYELGEAITSAQGSSNFSSDTNKASALQLMVRTLVGSSVSSHPHPAVKLTFFETVVRYDKFFLCEQQQIPTVIMAFLDERGMRHSSPKVRSRVAYLFSRFVKTVKAQLSNYTKEILTQLSDLLVLTPPSPSASPSILSPDDQLFIFETAAVLIVNADFDQETKTLLIQRLLEPVLASFIAVLDQVRREPAPAQVAALDTLAAQAVNACTWCSKAFNNQQTMKAAGGAATFTEAVQIFFKSAEVPQVLPEFQAALRQYCHRLVVCLDRNVIPLMPAISEALLRSRDAASLTEYIPLINQVITKFKKEAIPFLNAAFRPIVAAIFAALGTSIDETDEEMRLERQALQRGYFSFVAAVAGNNLVEVLLAQDPALMQQVLMSVIQGAVEFCDPLAQKGCYSILKKLVELWSKNGPPGFVEFLYEHIVPACFLGPLRKSFDLSDAQTVVALSEAAACLKTVYEQRRNIMPRVNPISHVTEIRGYYAYQAPERGELGRGSPGNEESIHRGEIFGAQITNYLQGEEAVTFLQSQYLPSLDIPPQKILEFCQALRMELKVFKQFLKVFFLEAKR